MEATPDDPLESHDRSKDDDNDDAVVQTWPSSTELANQTSETTYNDNSDQDETQSVESGIDISQTESKASEKSPCKLQQGAIFSGKILSFCCSECKDDTTYSPNDLLKHFQATHKGSLPTYPCDLCTFVTNEFPSLQRHRIGHRDTLVTCEICNDGVQYSLLFLTRHFIMCHSCNGLFRCKKCDFSTRDAGTFVQHIHYHNEGSHKCVRYPPLSPTHGKVHSGTFPFTCQFCGYGAARREYLSKHLTVAHGEEMDRANRWKSTEDNSGVNSPGLKMLLKKSPTGAARDPQWMTKLNSFPGVGLLDHSGRLFNPEKTLEETQQFLERAVGVKKESNLWNKCPLKSEPQCSYPVTPTTPQPKTQENELSSGSGNLNPSNSNGLTVLMVKNKISIPPNCTTKVMGFKMVDGKKHLVLKVIPTKQEPSTKNEMSPGDVSEDDKKTASSLCSPLSLKSKSFFGLDSSNRFEAQDIERDSEDQSPLLELEARLDRTSLAINQVGMEALEKSSQLLTPPSDPHCVDLVSSITKEASLCMNLESHPDGKSPQHEHELSVPFAKKTHSADATAAESTTTNMLKEKEAPSESFTKLETVVDTGEDETLQAEPNAVELISIRTNSDVKSDLMLVSASDAPPSALTSNCIADDATNGIVSDESVEQMGHLVDDQSCSDKFTGDSSACENIIEQSSPRSHVKKSQSSVSEDEEKQPLICDESTNKSTAESTATIASSPMLSNEKTSQADSLTDLMLPTDTSSTKKQVPDNAVVDNESLSVTPNGATLLDISPQNRASIDESPDAKDCNTTAEILLQNSPSQEVFSFHNYSKDSFGSSPDSLEGDEHSPEDLEEDECEDDFDELKLASDWSLTLPASPPFANEQSEEENVGSMECSTGDDLVLANDKKALERVSDSDIEVDECIATVDDLPISELPETDRGAACLSESGKKDSVSPAIERGTATLSNAAVLGKILEQHSDAIISQQLEKERMVSSAATTDAIRSTKTTLRILQMPEGKQQMFLKTTETPYAVPVQLTNSPGFKLITKSCASTVNVSYVKPGIERPSKGTGLSVTLNGGRIGMSAQASGGEGEGHTSLLQAVSSSGGRLLVSSSALKGPLLLSSAVKPPSGEQTANSQPTCYLVQRPLPVVPVSKESTGSTSKTVLTTHPILAMPVNSADKGTPLQTGTQAYLVRYISPAKSGILLNSSDAKGANQGSQVTDGGKNKVFLKIVRSPNGTRFLSTAPCNSDKKPIYVAASSLQSPYLLMSSNKSLTSLSAGLKTSSTHEPIPTKFKNILPQSSIDIKNKVEDSEVLQKSPLLRMHTRPRSQRKRRRRCLFEETLEISPKTRRFSSKSSEVALLWEPAAKDVERTLRLSPFSPLQQIKCPHRNQPVVVLNHPDADIPEVVNIMKSVNRYKSEVVRVVLSQSTVKALSEWSLIGPEGTLSKAGSRVRPLGSKVKEHFILKLKLKKTTKSKYEVVRLSSTTRLEQTPRFSCWFCGRKFNNQEEWIGHGQRHLMEATRDWNKLF